MPGQGLISPVCEQPLDFLVAQRVTLRPGQVLRITVGLPLTWAQA